MKLSTLLVITLFLLAVLLLVVYFFSFILDQSFLEKGGAFECGFYSFSGSSLSFSVPFFVISLMFLLFDVEILLVCFFPLMNSFSFYSFYFLWVVISFILMATLYEWSKGVLSWV